MPSSSQSSSTRSTPINTDGKSAASSSPATTMTSTLSEPDNTITDNNNINYNNNNSLDDIFGSSPDERSHHYSQQDEFLEEQHAMRRNRYYETTQSTSNTVAAPVAVVASAEPSDLPSLRRQHVTAGYRDGIASSKSEHVQSGFDGGYPVGAQFGLRVGTILGILEGIVGGLESNNSGAGPVKKKRSIKQNADDDDNTGKHKEIEEAQRQRIERLMELYKSALKELNVETLFGGLKADDEEGDGENNEGKGIDFTEETKPENRLRQKAEPIVAKWEKLVDVTKWEESMEAVDSMEDLNAEEMNIS